MEMREPGVQMQTLTDIGVTTLPMARRDAAPRVGGGVPSSSPSPTASCSPTATAVGSPTATAVDSRIANAFSSIRTPAAVRPLLRRNPDRQKEK